MIKVAGLSKSFGRNEVLKGVDLRVGEGELVVLLGPNGSGKSTLFRSLMGLISYDGEVELCGRSPLREGKRVRREIGFMPQQCGLHLDLTVAETLEFYAMIRETSTEAAYNLLEKVRLGHVSDYRVGELSGGMRQRLAFVVASFARPKVLLLDEPIANLDSESQTLILSHLVELHEQKTTILLSTHMTHDLLHLADRSVMMENGRLWDVPPSVRHSEPGLVLPAVNYQD